MQIATEVVRFGVHDPHRVAEPVELEHHAFEQRLLRVDVPAERRIIRNTIADRRSGAGGAAQTFDILAGQAYPAIGERGDALRDQAARIGDDLVSEGVMRRIGAEPVRGEERADPGEQAIPPFACPISTALLAIICPISPPILGSEM
ncbi:hypothetical protein QP166_17710 [Sphingomonas sp. LR60]|uniref:hypothetical protein n=1 Tax=Sphingomonas sp. LR60 TaxID=3050233 RepID=UPI002FDF924E